jgi:hypothetical protein
MALVVDELILKKGDLHMLKAPCAHQSGIGDVILSFATCVLKVTPGDRKGG